jgi:cystathionine gamma-synthase
VHKGTLAPDTWAVIAGRGAHAPGSPLNVPPVLASNLVLGGDRAYTRDDGMSTWEAFEELLDGLEHGVTVAFASGMAAAAATFDLLPADAEVRLAP